jgi:excisionase family DNA binding protein
MGEEERVSSPFLSVRDVAKFLDRSEPRIYQMVNAGEIPATRVGRRIVIPRAALDAWLEEKTRRALAAVAR